MFNLLTTYTLPEMDFGALATQIIESSSGAIGAGLLIFGAVTAVVVGKKFFKAAK